METTHTAVEAPLGDFFAVGHGLTANVNSAQVATIIARPGIQLLLVHALPEIGKGDPYQRVHR